MVMKEEMSVRMNFPHQTDKDPSRGTKQEGKRWNKEHTTYKCADGINVLTLGRTVKRDQDGSEETRTHPKYASGISYKVLYDKKIISVFVSETQFNRDMSRVAQGANYAKTITFPSAVRDVAASAFRMAALLSVVLNEGLRTLGENQG